MADLERLQQIASGLSIPAVRRHIFLCADQTKPKCCSQEAGVAAWDYLKNLAAEENEHLINEFFRHLCVTATDVGGLFSSFFYQVTIRRHLGSVIKKRGISGGVLRSMLADCVYIASIRDHGCVLL